MEIEKFKLEDAEKEQRVRQLLSLGWSKVKCEYCEGMGSVRYKTIDQPIECGQCNGVGKLFTPPPATVRDAIAEIMDKPVIDLEKEAKKLKDNLEFCYPDLIEDHILKAFKRVRGE